MNKSKIYIAFGILLIAFLGCSEAEPPVGPESPTVSNVSVASGKDFVGVWQIKTVCEPQHHEDAGHGPVGSKFRTPHGRKGGWYAIYPKGNPGSDTYGIMISEEFADFRTQEELINWNEVELQFKSGNDPQPTGSFKCLDPSDVDMLTTKTPARLHNRIEHVVMVYLHYNSSEHPGVAAPVINIKHSTNASLHNGILH